MIQDEYGLFHCTALHRLRITVHLMIQQFSNIRPLPHPIVHLVHILDRMPATLQDLTVEYEYTYAEYCFDGRWWWLNLIDWERLDLQLTTHKTLKHVSFVFSHSSCLRRADKVEANAQDIATVKRLLPHAVAEGLLEFTSRTSLSEFLFCCSPHT